MSYGRDYVTTRDTVVGVVPVGYAHGLSRAYSAGGSVLYRGRHVPVLGRITMDMTLVDLSGFERPQVGEEIVIFCRQGGEEITVDEIGARTEWFNGRLRLNLTYFDMAYTNRQGAVNIPDPSLPTGFRIQLVNTGDVDVSGFELEGQVAATENFLIDFSAGDEGSLPAQPLRAAEPSP